MAEYTITYINQDTKEESQLKVMASSHHEADEKAKEHLFGIGISHKIIKTRKAQFYDSDHYYDVLDDCKEMFDDISIQYNAFGIGSALTETAKQSPRILGKTLFNTGLFTAKASVECVRQLPSILGSAVEQEIKKGRNPKNLSEQEIQDIEQKAKGLSTLKLWRNEKLDD